MPSLIVVPSLTYRTIWYLHLISYSYYSIHI